MVRQQVRALWVVSLVAGLAAVAVGVIALLRTGDSNTSAPTTAFGDPSRTSTAAGTPTPTVTPGISATPITVGPDIDFPPDMMMLVVLGPFGKGAGPFSISRAYRLGDDLVQLEVLFPPEAVAGGGYAGNVTDDVWPTGFMVNPLSRSIVAAVCYGTGCGHEGGTGGESARTVFFESRDGGSSWSEVDAFEGEWYPRAIDRDRVIAVNYAGSDPEARLVPGGEPFVTPPGLFLMSGPPLLPGAGALFISPDGQSIVNDISGVEFRPDFPAPFALGPVARLTDFLPIAAVIRERNDEPYDPRFVPRRLRSFLGIYGGRGKQRELFELPENLGVASVARQLENGQLLATFTFWDRPATCTSGGTSAGAVPALFDPRNARVQFIAVPFLDPGCPGGSQEVIAVRQGHLARVDTPGDCLNLRERPEADAAVIACVPHGTIVENDGTVWYDRWTDVTLFDGREGWATLAYVDAGSRP